MLRLTAPALVVGLAACTASSETAPAPPIAEPSTFHAPVPSATMPELKHIKPVMPSDVIHLDVLPDKLPAGVVAQVPNVAKMEAQVDDNTHNVGSAVRIGRDEYFTAGHAIMREDGSRIERTRVCGAITVRVTTQKPTAKQTSSALFGTTLSAQKAFGAYFNDESSLVPDIALINTTAQSVMSSYSQPTTMREGREPAPGAYVFLASYQKTPAGESRNPDEHELSNPDIHEGLNQPAIIGGIVLRSLSNGNLVVATGLKSYSNPMDTFIRPSASGGPVYDASGRLVGITERQSAATVRGVEQSEGVQLSGLPPSAPLQYTVVQVVNNDLLAAARRAVASEPVCNPA